jgi:hypothetical protein
MKKPNLLVNDDNLLVCGDCGHFNPDHGVKTYDGLEKWECEKCSCSVLLSPTKRYVLKAIDCFANEYYTIDDYDTLESAKKALARQKRSLENSQGQGLRDHVWIEENLTKAA